MTFYKLYQGDCLQILPTLSDKSVDFTISSPPFKTYTNDYDRSDKYYDWFGEVLDELDRVTKHYSFLFNSSTRIKEICRRFDPERILIWYKGVMKYAYRYEPIFIFKHDHCEGNLKINKRIFSDTFKFQPKHEWKVPYENPVSLYNALIKMVTKPGDIILDPFIGSGTTMQAAQDLQRSCIGIELESSYCEVVKKRCFGRQFLDRNVEYEFLD